MATSGTFGIVDTDNNAAVTGFQWEEPDVGDLSFPGQSSPAKHGIISPR